jgi:hypothetical protein
LESRVRPKLPGEELGTLSLPSLRLTLKLCYANFVTYLLLYFTGMYINIYITSGINPVGIDDPTNMVHMILSSVIFVITLTVSVTGFLYGMRKVALFSTGALACLVAATIGGLLFLSTGGARGSGGLTLEGGWIMSILFMLALFLSYYATLKIMRAIRVIETFDGEAP